MDQTGLLSGVRFAFVVAALYVLGAIIRQVRRKREAWRARVQRRKRLVAAIALFQPVLMVSLWLSYRAGLWTASSVGVSTEVSPLLAFAAGFGEYFLFAWACNAFALGVGARLTYSTATLRANAILLPSAPARRALLLGMIGIGNPITEELLFRGLLVYQFHSIGAPLGLAIGLGAVVNSINHAYQGRILALFHLAFYACTVALLYSPLGLCGAIGMHFAADVMPWLGYRKQLQNYRSLQREARRTKSQPTQT